MRPWPRCRPCPCGRQAGTGPALIRRSTASGTGLAGLDAMELRRSVPPWKAARNCVRAEQCGAARTWFWHGPELEYSVQWYFHSQLQICVSCMHVSNLQYACEQLQMMPIRLSPVGPLGYKSSHLLHQIPYSSAVCLAFHRCAALSHRPELSGHNAPPKPEDLADYHLPVVQLMHTLPKLLCCQP